jgi:alkanesulfonate monooxygenase SsuD/methylene tetrahydromethanopterin reductase-like flavin-dependent oxidoreductase (luciferase family)
VPSLRFCAYEYQSIPFETLHDRLRRAEELGFDLFWNCDTVVEPDHPRTPMFDGPATLTAMAIASSTIRIGTLVTSQYFRHPVTLVKAAITVDHLSGGRLEVALGVGDPSAGSAAVGASLSPAEGVERFREFVQLTSLLFANEVTTFTGRFFNCREAEMLPRAVQDPRPNITIAAHGPKMLRIAAESADAWSSWGGYGVETEDDFLAVTAARSAELTRLCAERQGSGLRPTVARLLPTTHAVGVRGVLPRYGRALPRCRDRRVRSVLASSLATGSHL